MKKIDPIFRIIDDAKWFEGKNMEDNSQGNLRSFVAHKQSISERLEKYFQVHYLTQDQVPLYDTESRGIPFSRQHMKWERTFPT